MVLTVPFVFPLHMEPYDFRRLTLHGVSTPRCRSRVRGRDLGAARRAHRGAGDARRGCLDPAAVTFAGRESQGRRVAVRRRRDGPAARFIRAVAGPRHQLELLFEQRRRVEGDMSGGRDAIRTLGAIRRRIFERPEKAAWRTACRQAEVTPRFTPGRIRMMDLDIRYSDLLTLCPQWDDIFVKRTLALRERDAVTAHSRLRRQRRPREPVLPAPLSAARGSPRSKPTRRCSRSSTPTSGRTAPPRSKPRHAAVWTSTGTLTFQCEGSDSGMISSLPARSAAARTTVPSLRLRDVIEEGPVDLLKLDIEGAEDVGAGRLRAGAASRQGDRDGPARVRSGGAAGAARARAADARRLQLRDRRVRAAAVARAGGRRRRRRSPAGRCSGR